MPAKLLQRQHAAGPQLYELLRRRVLTGEAPPGMALSEARVALEFGVSRTPVREVFRRLAEEGFLRVIPQVGTYVAPIKIAAVRDSQFVRETLECRVVAIAAARADQPAVRRLRATLDDQARAIDTRQLRAFFAADEAMHRALMEIAGHPAVWDLIASAKTQLDRVRHLSLESPEWLQMIFAQHVRLVDLVEAQDGVAATAAMREHLRTAFAAIERIASEHAEFFDAPAATGMGAQLVDVD